MKDTPFAVAWIFAMIVLLGLLVLFVFLNSCGSAPVGKDMQVDLSQTKDRFSHVEEVLDDQKIRYCGDRVCDVPTETILNCFKDCGPGLSEEWNLLPDFIDPMPIKERRK